MAEKLLLDSLFYLVGRVRVLAELFEQQLRGEFYFEKTIQEEWEKKMLPYLERAALPLQEFLQKHFGKEETFIRKNASYWVVFHREVEGGIQALQANVETVIAIKKALAHVTRARFALRHWQIWLRGEGAQQQRNDQLLSAGNKGSSIPELGDAINEFDRAVQAGDEVKICRSSRLLFLILYYGLALTPNQVEPRDFQRIIALHQAAVRKMKLVDLRDHTKERLGYLAYLDAETYAAIALEPEKDLSKPENLHSRALGMVF